MNGTPFSTALKRYATAFAVSLLCHAIFVVAVLSTMSAVAPATRPIVVTMWAGDGGAAGSGRLAAGESAAGAGEDASTDTASSTSGAPVAAAPEPAARVETARPATAPKRAETAQPAPERRRAPKPTTRREKTARRERERRRAALSRLDAAERTAHVDDRAADVDARAAKVHDRGPLTRAPNAEAYASHADDPAAGSVAEPADDAGPGGRAAGDEGRSDDHIGDAGTGADRENGGSSHGAASIGAGNANSGHGAASVGAGGAGGGPSGTDAAGAHAGGSAGGDLRARCVACPTPDYPPRARRQGWEGTVDVALRVGADGAVERAQVGRSSGFALLDAAAVAVARRSRFHVTEHTTGLSGVLRYRFVLEEPRAVKPF